jgi:hypothetical protein
MSKLGPNDKCHCNSDKKYKKCCFLKDEQAKQEEKLKYTNGQETSSNKMTFCINHYKDIFNKDIYNKYKIIDITDNINPDNYKTYLTKNYFNKIIMLAEKTDANQELFEEKSDTHINDLIIMYKGAYRVIQVNNILRYDDDIKKFINEKDNI